MDVFGLLQCSFYSSTGGCCGWHAIKPLPDGVSYQGAQLPCTDARFLCDVTGLDENGARKANKRSLTKCLQ